MYEDFAILYDVFMKDVPYQRWCDRIVEWLTMANNIMTESVIVDLACGTGTLTEMLAERGYRMIGIDNASEMLAVACRKKNDRFGQTLYLCQDMQRLTLHEPVAAIICVCDSLNYLLTDDDILATFQAVRKHLLTDGLFIFDFNTLSKYEKIGEATIAEDDDAGAFIWQNYFDVKSGLNEYNLTLFLKERDGRFRRSHELHVQKGYELSHITDLLKKAGLEMKMAIDDETGEAPSGVSEKIVVMATRTQK